MSKNVDAYFERASQWSEEMHVLRELLLSCGLDEELKWSKPCYSFENKNIVVIQGFKAYCAVLFFKGVLLSDANDVLIKTGKNTRVGRQIRFENVKQVKELAGILKAYVYEAIEIEKAGIKVPEKTKRELPMPDELEKAFKTRPALKSAFEKLTPGRRRGYLIYFAQPKQSKTRETRIEKYTRAILNGKGLHDR